MSKPDLIVLVADSNMKGAVEGVLSRALSLKIAHVQSHVVVHPDRDSGCRLHGHELLRTQQHYSYALMMFDLEGCGAKGQSRIELEQETEQKLAASGWSGRSAAVVIDPELDVWVWSDSPWVDRILGWEGRNPNLRAWLKQQGFSFGLGGKPNRPKEALEIALRASRQPRSSAIYKELAENVSIERCADLAFLKLKGALQNWFGKL